jgi:DNA-binding response OmpR family regulator
METKNILIIEDDEIVARTIERSLRGYEFHITIANSGVKGLKAARRSVPDLVILDVIMPGMDGYTVCAEMRADPILSDVPILFLTAKSKEEDKIAGFRVGADDYMSKPFNIDELMLRVRAILRRAKPRVEEQSITSAATPVDAVELRKMNILPMKKYREIKRERRIEINGFLLDTQTFELTTPSHEKVLLTPVQFDLLYHLMSHPGEIFSPARLLDEVWDYPSDTGSPDLVRVHIKNLRKRIESNPSNPIFIRTVPGYGYTITTEDDGNIGQIESDEES